MRADAEFWVGRVGGFVCGEHDGDERGLGEVVVCLVGESGCDDEAAFVDAEPSGEVCVELVVDDEGEGRVVCAWLGFVLGECGGVVCDGGGGEGGGGCAGSVCAARAGCAFVVLGCGWLGVLCGHFWKIGR